MSIRVQQFFDRLAELFAEDRLDRITDHFSYPLPFFANDGLLVFGNAASFGEALTLYRNATRKAGIVRLQPRVVANGVPVRDYSNVWVEWDHADAAGRVQRTSQVRYAVYHPKSVMLPRVELIDYTVTAFPELQPELPLCKSA